MKIVFIHGWGCDAEYWQPLAAVLNYYETDRIDIGFTGNENLNIDTNRSVTYIAHSLGTLWVLKNALSSAGGLITINGFSNFAAFTPGQTLEAMKLGLSKNPKAQMRGFYKMADMSYEDKEWDTARLSEGLDWLGSWDMSEELSKLSCPVLSLIGAKDRIVPLEAAQQQWQGRELRVCEDGGHNLPQTHTQWCASHIEDFIKGEGLSA